MNLTMSGPRFLHCLPAEQAKLRLAVQSAKAKLIGGLCGLSGLDELRRFMLARLNGYRPLTIRCSECESLPADGYTLERGKGDIVLCRSLLAGPQDRVDTVLFHELVHACGGDELDGEGLECHCFKEGAATLPGGSDYRLFRSLPVRNGYHVGNYLMWSPSTGQVFVRAPGNGPGAALNVRFLRPRR